MNKRNLFWFFLVVTFAVLFLLLTGSSILLLAIDNNNTVPLGSFITWAGMISLPAAVYYGIGKLRNPTGIFLKILSVLLKIIMILGLLWLPVSYLLSGNWAFLFSEKETFQGGQEAMKLFWILSYTIPIGGLSILFLYWVSLLFAKIQSILRKS